MKKPIPIEDAIKFWEMKEEIEGLLCRYHNNEALDHDSYMAARKLIIKIESLGKKEEE